MAYALSCKLCFFYDKMLENLYLKLTGIFFSCADSPLLWKLRTVPQYVSIFYNTILMLNYC